jgi:hypothetical protein
MTKLQAFLNDRDDNWPIHLATPCQLEAFAIAVTDDESAVKEAFAKLTIDVFNEMAAEAAKDFRPAPAPAATKVA